MNLEERSMYMSRKLKLEKKFRGGYTRFFLDEKTKEKVDKICPPKIITFEGDDEWWDDDTTLI